jgi:hypothetical protein
MWILTETQNGRRIYEYAKSIPKIGMRSETEYSIDRLKQSLQNFYFHLRDKLELIGF